MIRVATGFGGREAGGREAGTSSVEGSVDDLATKTSSSWRGSMVFSFFSTFRAALALIEGGGVVFRSVNRRKTLAILMIRFGGVSIQNDPKIYIYVSTLLNSF